MKKFFAFVFACLLAFSVHSAEKKNIRFSLEPFFSFSSGTINEIIYHKTDRNKKISLLEWERNLWLYGLQINFAVEQFHIAGSIQKSLPFNSGEMRDSDWLNAADYSMKTTYSVGKNEALENYDAEISLAYDFFPSGEFSVSPVASIQYQYDSFRREKNAEGWYGHSDYSTDKKNHWWYEEEAKHFPTEYYWSEEKQKYVRQQLAGVSYNRHSLYVWTGLSLGLNTRHFNGSFQAQISPFTYFSAEDKHDTSEDDSICHLIQQAIFSNIKYSINTNFKLTERLELTAQAIIITGKEIKGNLYEDWHLNKNQKSGTSTEQFSIKAGCKVNF